MNHLNSILLEGVVCSQPEWKRAGRSGFALFSIASHRYYRTKDTPEDEWEDEVLFMEVLAWSQLGRKCTELLDKGTAVKVIGRLRQYSYLPKDGEKKAVRTSIVARHIELKLTDRAAGAQQDSVTIDEEQGEAGELSEPIMLYEY